VLDLIHDLENRFWRDPPNYVSENLILLKVSVEEG
jgi:hypothetical protein